MAYRREIRAQRDEKPTEPNPDDVAQYIVALADRHDHIRLPALRLIARVVESQVTRRVDEEHLKATVVEAVTSQLAEARRTTEEVVLLARISAMLVMLCIKDSAVFATASGEHLAATLPRLLLDEAVEGSWIVTMMDALCILTAFATDGELYFPGTQTPLCDWIAANVDFEAVSVEAAVPLIRYCVQHVAPSTAPAQELVRILHDVLLPRLLDADAGLMAEAISSVYEVIVDRFEPEEYFAPSAFALDRLAGNNKEAHKALQEVKRFIETGEATPTEVVFDLKVPVRFATHGLGVHAEVALTSGYAKGFVTASRAVFGPRGIRIETLPVLREYLVGIVDPLTFTYAEMLPRYTSKRGEPEQLKKSRDQTRRAQRGDKAQRQEY